MIRSLGNLVFLEPRREYFLRERKSNLFVAVAFNSCSFSGAVY